MAAAERDLKVRQVQMEPETEVATVVMEVTVPLQLYAIRSPHTLRWKLHQVMVVMAVQEELVAKEPPVLLLSIPLMQAATCLAGKTKQTSISLIIKQQSILPTRAVQAVPEVMVVGAVWSRHRSTHLPELLTTRTSTMTQPVSHKSQAMLAQVVKLPRAVPEAMAALVRSL